MDNVLLFLAWFCWIGFLYLDYREMKKRMPWVPEEYHQPPPMADTHSDAGESLDEEDEQDRARRRLFWLQRRIRKIKDDEERWEEYEDLCDALWEEECAFEKKYKGDWTPSGWASALRKRR